MLLLALRITSDPSGSCWRVTWPYAVLIDALAPISDQSHVAAANNIMAAAALHHQRRRVLILRTGAWYSGLPEPARLSISRWADASTCPACTVFSLIIMFCIHNTAASASSLWVGLWFIHCSHCSTFTGSVLKYHA